MNRQPHAPDLPAHREEARQILEACERAGVAPEAGDDALEAIADFEALYEDGLLAQVPWLHLELGAAAGASEQGLAGTPRNLLRLVDALDGTLGQLRWVAHGESTATAAVCATAAALGGHIRVGLEEPRCCPMAHPRRPTADSSSSPSPLTASSLGREPMEPDDAAVASCEAERMGEARRVMIDVAAKPVTAAAPAPARAFASRPPSSPTSAAGTLPKGDVSAVARVAAITGSKQTPALLPLCHPLALTHVTATLELDDGGVDIEVVCETTRRDRREVEAMTA